MTPIQVRYPLLSEHVRLNNAHQHIEVSTSIALVDLGHKINSDLVHSVCVGVYLVFNLSNLGDFAYCRNCSYHQQNLNSLLA